jgi:hypothetical protein
MQPPLLVKPVPLLAVVLLQTTPPAAVYRMQPPPMLEPVLLLAMVQLHTAPTAAAVAAA